MTNHIDAAHMLRIVEQCQYETVPIWIASREFKSVSKINLYQAQIKAHAHAHVGGAYIGLYHAGGRFSLEDQNVIPNNYNDWYVFDSEEKARAHAGL